MLYTTDTEAETITIHEGATIDNIIDLLFLLPDECNEYRLKIKGLPSVNDTVTTAYEIQNQ